MTAPGTAPADGQARPPGQAEYEAYNDAILLPGSLRVPWDDIGELHQSAWAAAAKAAIEAAPGTGMYLAAIARLSAALRGVCEETGTSSLAHHIARDALADLDQPQRLPDLRRELGQARAALQRLAGPESLAGGEYMGAPDMELAARIAYAEDVLRGKITPDVIAVRIGRVLADAATPEELAELEELGDWEDDRPVPSESAPHDTFTYDGPRLAPLAKVQRDRAALEAERDQARAELAAVEDELTATSSAAQELREQLDQARVQLAIATTALRNIALGTVRDPSVAADTALVAVRDQEPAATCGACFHLLSLHVEGACQGKVYPAHSLTGEPCPCTQAPASASPDGGGGRDGEQ